MPGMPSTPSAVETGASAGSILRSPLPSETAWVCQPVRTSTMSPSAKPSRFDATTSLTVPPSITPPIGDRRGIGRRIAHAPAHIGIERKPQRAQQHLARPGPGDRHRLDAEIAFFRLADRPRREHDAFARRHAHARLG